MKFQTTNIKLKSKIKKFYHTVFFIFNMCFVVGGIFTFAESAAGADDDVEYANAGKEKVSITDACGHKFDIACPVQRLIVTNSDAAEVLCALGAADKIVGITDHTARICSDLFSELKGKTIVGSWQNPSLEKIIELKPDAVITYDKWRPAEEDFAQRLARFNIAVIRAPCYKIDSLAEDIRILGKITGKEKKAEVYIDYYQKILEHAESRLKNLKRKTRVYAESYTNYYAVSKGSGAYEILERAGADNITGDQPIPSPLVSPEWIVDKNPEIIIKSASSGYLRMGYGCSDINAVAMFWNVLIKRPVWDRIEAVQKNRVYLICPEIWSGPRAAIGIIYIAKWCYPQEFRDIDPEAIHQQWLMKWHNKELKGIYVYPGN